MASVSKGKAWFVGTVVVILLGVLALLFLGGEAQEGSQPTYETVPSVALKDKEGKEINVSSFVGRPHIINSWASWCPFCVDELPDFVRLQEEFPSIVVIAVNRRESVERSVSFLETIAVDEGALTFLYDDRDRFYQQIGGFSMPETLFVDADGNIIVHKRGFMDLNEMRAHTKRIISE